MRQWIGAARGPFVIGVAFWFLSGWSFFDPFHEHVEKGNHEAKKGKPTDALGHYETAGKLAPASPIPDFNRGIVYSQKGDVDQARSAFEAAQASEDKGIAADAHYNLGNLLLQKDDAAGAIEQYLRSLDLNPSDPDARRNLEIAIRRKEEQQKQQQQQQQQQKNDPSQKDQDKKQQNEDQKKDESGEKKDQEQQKPDSGKKDEQKPPQDSSQENPQQQNQENPGDKQESPLRPEEQLSKEDAARLLNAIQNDELKVLRALEDKKEQGGAVGNDW